MNTKWEIRVALILILILVTVSLGGCSVPQIQGAVQESTGQEQPTQELEREGIPNFQGIADALGCVFAPDKCGK
jgi:PBP1b-binding outer membrane lipoprotein LpoB